MYIFFFCNKNTIFEKIQRKGMDARDTRHRRHSFGSTLCKKMQTKEYKSMIVIVLLRKTTVAQYLFAFFCFTAFVLLRKTTKQYKSMIAHSAIIIALRAINDLLSGKPLFDPLDPINDCYCFTT